MSGTPAGTWPPVQVHPGAGLVDRRGDILLVVPEPATDPERVRDLLQLCHRPDPTGEARVEALRALLDASPPSQMPGFALLVRTGHRLRVLVHGRVWVLVDGRAAARPGAGGRGTLAEHVVEDGAWQGLTVTAEPGAATPAAPDALGLDLEAGSVPGAGVTLRALEGWRAQPPAAQTEAAADPQFTRSSTMLRPAIRFRAVPLGECAVRGSGAEPARARRAPLPVAGARSDGAAGARTRGPEVLVEGVHCPRRHFTDPDAPACLTCGTPLPADGPRVRLPRPPLGMLVTDGGTIYTVTGDLVIGREPEQAPEVLEGRARPLPLRDAARSTSRVHARLTVDGWKVRLIDNGSANGTFVSGHGAAGPWLPAPPQDPITLAHGNRIRLGRRQLLFDPWREAVVPQVFQ